MGAASTNYVTRQQAEERFVELYLGLRARTRAIGLAAGFSDSDLEQHLNLYEEERHGGAVLETYRIKHGEN